jgi:type IV secretory pathway VirB10-like protein
VYNIGKHFICDCKITIKTITYITTHDSEPHPFFDGIFFNATKGKTTTITTTQTKRQANNPRTIARLANTKQPRHNNTSKTRAVTTAAHEHHAQKGTNRKYHYPIAARLAASNKTRMSQQAHKQKRCNRAKGQAENAGLKKSKDTKDNNESNERVRFDHQGYKTRTDTPRATMPQRKEAHARRKKPEHQQQQQQLREL